MPSMVTLPPRPNWPADEISTELRLGGVEVRRGRVAGNQQRQLEEVAAVERQLVDGLRADDRVDDRARGVDDADAGAGDGDRLVDAGDRQRDLEVQRLADAQHDVGVALLGEVRRRHRDGDVAGGEVGDGERAGLVGGGLADQPGGRRRDGDLRAGHCAPLRVADLAAHRGRRARLRHRHARCRQKHQHYCQDPTSLHHDPSYTGRIEGVCGRSPSVSLGLVR